MKLDLAQVRRYGNLELMARQLVEGFITGLHRSPYHGFSVEFAEHKQYNFGESIRHVDWKVYGRTEKLYTKRYEEETNLRCLMVMDASASMYYPEPHYGKLTFSVVASACLAYLLHRQRDAIGLCTFRDRIELKTQVKSTPAHIQMLYGALTRQLETTPPPSTTRIAQVLHEVADLMKRRALVVIFSDMFEQATEETALFGALQHLKHNHHEVILFHTVDKQTEQEFVFEDRPYEFIDKESGARIRMRPTEAQEWYKKRSSAFFHSLRLKCAQYKITLIEVDVQQGVDQVLLPYLIKRRGMR
jgi:uncharacterized protein (DUF58 family)